MDVLRTTSNAVSGMVSSASIDYSNGIQYIGHERCEQSSLYLRSSIERWLGGRLVVAIPFHLPILIATFWIVYIANPPLTCLVPITKDNTP